MTREKWSRHIQANQRIDNSSRDWVEGLVSEIFDDFESGVCENCKHGKLDKVYKIIHCSLMNDGVSKDFGCNKFIRK